MAIYPFLVAAYTKNIYFHGNRKFSGIPEEYHEPVKQQGAKDYDYQAINLAFEKGYITQEEFDETLNYKYPDGVPPIEELETWSEEKTK
ncbi:hypothetical protein NYE67_20740 [Solibacillus sp. FSL W8-0474]|uniref:hypothetical protein n=1 Tax=Solibacillus sp. FSL W8-0474 TaxID=2975336 RepID=UPI0030FC3AD2